MGGDVAFGAKCPAQSLDLVSLSTVSTCCTNESPSCPETCLRCFSGVPIGVPWAGRPLGESRQVGLRLPGVPHRVAHGRGGPLGGLRRGAGRVRGLAQRQHSGAPPQGAGLCRDWPLPRSRKIPFSPTSKSPFLREQGSVAPCGFASQYIYAPSEVEVFPTGLAARGTKDRPFRTAPRWAPTTEPWPRSFLSGGRRCGVGRSQALNEVRRSKGKGLMCLANILFVRSRWWAKVI